MIRRRLLMIVLCAVATAIALRLVSHEIRVSRKLALNVTAPNGVVSASARALRPDYPYSVIRGGAYSPAELRYANEKDSVVREHYADFDLHAARLVTLTADRYQYVSFRIKNRIFWTHNKLRIPKGEVLLTDGEHFARTRCGNRLSSKSQQDTTPLQPSEKVLSLPAFRPELLKKGEVALAPAPPIGELAQALPRLPFEMPLLAPVLPPAVTPSENWPPTMAYVPWVPITGGYIPTPGPGPQSPGSPAPLSGGGPPSTPVISEVPEPASLYLFGLTLCASLWILTRMMRPRHGPRDVPKEGEN